MRNRWNAPGRPGVRARFPGRRWASIAILVAGLFALLVPAQSLLGPTVGPRSVAATSSFVSAASTPATDPLAITSFASSLATMHQGESTYLNVTATGGSPPYTYWYEGLPLGCHSQNFSSIRCYPTEAERFTITAFVNDTAGASVNASLVLAVSTGYGGPPFIHYFYASPSTVSVLAKVLIYANATSNSSTPTQNLKFAYLDLPPGCAGFNQTVLECVPTGAGVFHLYLLVTDGFGAFATARAWLNVTGGNTTSSSGPALSPAMQEGLAVVGVGLLVVIAAIFLIPRVRKPRPGAPVQPWKP